MMSQQEIVVGIHGLCQNLSDYYDAATCVINWFLLPLLCSIGFLLNVLAILIFSLALYLGHRTSMTVYLIALSVFDSVQLFFSVFIISCGGWQFLEYPNERELIFNRETYDTIYLINTYVTIYFYPLLMAANYGSIWIVTLICVQRYFAICFPLSSLRTIELRRATMEVFGISTIALLLNVCRFWEFQLGSLRIPAVPLTSLGFKSAENDTRATIGRANETDVLMSTMIEVFIIEEGPFRNRTAHPYFLPVMDGVLYILLLYTVPFAIVSVLNAKIVMVIYEARRMMSRMSQRRRREHRSALMVLTIILLFFACYTLAVAERIWSIKDPDGAESTFGIFLNMVSNLMVNLNSTIDPLIYFLFSRGFKDMFAKIRSRRPFGSELSSNQMLRGTTSGTDSSVMFRRKSRAEHSDIYDLSPSRSGSLAANQKHLQIFHHSESDFDISSKAILAMNSPFRSSSNSAASSGTQTPPCPLKTSTSTSMKTNNNDNNNKEYSIVLAPTTSASIESTPTKRSQHHVGSSSCLKPGFRFRSSSSGMPLRVLEQQQQQERRQASPIGRHQDHQHPRRHYDQRRSSSLFRLITAKNWSRRKQQMESADDGDMAAAAAAATAEYHSKTHAIASSVPKIQDESQHGEKAYCSCTVAVEIDNSNQSEISPSSSASPTDTNNTSSSRSRSISLKTSSNPYAPSLRRQTPNKSTQNRPIKRVHLNVSSDQGSGVSSSQSSAVIRGSRNNNNNNDSGRHDESNTPSTSNNGLNPNDSVPTPPGQPNNSTTTANRKKTGSVLSVL